MNGNLNKLLAILLVLIAAQRGAAQERTSADQGQANELAAVAAAPESSKTNKATGKTPFEPQIPANAQANTECKLCRWLDVETATLSGRYFFVENSSHLITSNQMQDNVTLKGRFKLDAKGKYSINAGVFTGRHFIVEWNNTGVGKGTLFSNLFLKQLYFSAKPIKDVEVQYGGLYFNRGESTEITSYDNAGYLMGQRVVVKRPRELFFDEVSATYAYLGDITKPNINKRFFRLKESNYHQFLVAKKIGRRAAVSADYTFEAGREVLREAVKLNTKELRAVDALRFETYQRLDVDPDAGFAVSGEKLMFKRLALSGGFSRIDRNYGGLNGDRYGRGNHLFAIASFALSPEFSVSSFITHGVANDFPIGNHTRLETIFSYNVLKTLQKTALFK